MDRCATHGLATGPDGLCVLCRRERPPRSASPWRAFAIAGGVLLLVVVAGAIHLVNARAKPPAVAVATNESAKTATTSPPAPRAPTPAAEATAAPPATGPSEVDLAIARRSVEVTMYTTSWCPRCKEAKAWMARSSVSYTEKDIESSDANLAECKRYNPKASIPTTTIDGAVLIGFGERSYERAIDAAARNRWARP